jgi:GTPase
MNFKNMTVCQLNIFTVLSGISAKFFNYDPMNHKSGFVNIIGNPNVGKSTLMNAMVGEKLSVITSKSQTTRHRLLGIVNDDNYQIVYSDTPGILIPKYKMQEVMLTFVHTAIDDADIILYVTDVVEDIEKNKKYLEKLQKIDTPILLLINKIDLSNQEKIENLSQKWQVILPKAEVILVSAKMKFNLNYVFDQIIKLLPEHEPYFDKDALTDKPLRFFISEIIREKILFHYQKEVPYSVEIVVEEFKEMEDIIHISAVIFVARESQKGIIIGHKGKSLKNIGIESRKDIELFLGKKVFLETFVKVSSNWRDDKNTLKKFGYEL